MTIGSMLARFGGTYTIRKLGFKNALIITAGLTAIFTAAPAVFDIDTSYVLILGSLLAVGFFRAAHYVASTAIAFAEVRPEEVSRASTLSTVIQQISLSFGISFAGLTLYASAGRSSHFTAAEFILHIEHGKLTLYTGGYDTFVATRTAKRASSLRCLTT